MKKIENLEEIDHINQETITTEDLIIKDKVKIKTKKEVKEEDLTTTTKTVKEDKDQIIDQNKLKTLTIKNLNLIHH